MGVSSKVTINGQTFKKGLRLNGANIVEQLVTGQLTVEDLKRPTTWTNGGSLGGDQVTRLMGFNLAKNVKVAQRQETLAVAKYFQILVSNTPIDEEYTYRGKVYNLDGLKLSDRQRAEWKRLAKERDKARAKNEVDEEKYKLHEKAVLELDYSKASKITFDKAKLIQKQIDNILMNPEQDWTERLHKPDNDYVRGDWVLIFRGVRFKAFETSRSIGADVYFSKEDFEVVDDFNSITKIANIIQEKTKDGVVGGGFKVTNDNPRAAMLEYGGYEGGNSGPNIGSRYAHGVKDKHTWQAPKGFYRLTNAMWNDIAKDTKTGRYQSYIRKWINADLSNFSVADVDSAEVKKLLKKKTVRTNEIDLNKLTKGKVK